jgi:hypothetical protein
VRAAYDFDLHGKSDAQIDAWLAAAETEAWRQGGAEGAMADAWGDFRADVLARLTKAAVIQAHVELGRDGMGDDADEADFEAWMTYVADKIDDATGMCVTVSARRRGDVQTNAVSTQLDRDDEPEIGRLERALESLWEAFCADLSAWPTRIRVAALSFRDADVAEGAVEVQLTVAVGLRSLAGDATLVPDGDGYRPIGDEPSAWLSYNIVNLLTEELNERDFTLALEKIRAEASSRVVG